ENLRAEVGEVGVHPETPHPTDLSGLHRPETAVAGNVEYDSRSVIDLAVGETLAPVLVDEGAGVSEDHGDREPSGPGSRTVSGDQVANGLDRQPADCRDRLVRTNHQRR